MTTGKQERKEFFFSKLVIRLMLPRLDNALVHFLELVQKRHYEGWELVQAWC